MQKEKNIKIKYWIGFFYLLIILAFLYFLFSKFNIEQITTYKFIKSIDLYLLNIREANLVLVSFTFILLGILWIFLQGFGSPLILVSGFLFGPYLGTLLSVIALSIGVTLIYIFASYFFKDLIRKKFLNKYKYIEAKFKKKDNELYLILLFRFLGGIPVQIGNLLLLFLDCKLKNYIIGCLGFIPSVFILASFGSGLEKQIAENSDAPSFEELITSFEIYGPILGFLFLLILGAVLRKLFFKN